MCQFSASLNDLIVKQGILIQYTSYQSKEAKTLSKCLKFNTLFELVLTYNLQIFSYCKNIFLCFPAEIL